MADVIVQKFGGTSVVSSELRDQAVSVVRRALESGRSPIVVVSAMGRSGHPYSTDALIALAESCGAPVDGRQRCMITACGEVISAVVFAQSLIAAGIDALPLNGMQAGIITSGSHDNARIERVFTARIEKLLATGIVPVVTGFQGISEDNEVMTIGRGGSDTTAAALGAALNASEVEIYTDVDGVMTADPRLVPDARCIPEADYGEIRALAINGGQVVHAPALEIAAEFGVPLRIRSFNSEIEGTVVCFKSHGAPVTGIASYANITFFRISPKEKRSHATELRLFGLIARQGISINFIDVRPHEITFVVDNKWQRRICALLEKETFRFETESDFVKVSVTGLGMTGQPGMMATIVDTLSREHIRIYQSTDAQTSISCLIRKDDECNAVRLLHSAFTLADLGESVTPVQSKIGQLTGLSV